MLNGVQGDQQEHRPFFIRLGFLEFTVLEFQKFNLSFAQANQPTREDLSQATSQRSRKTQASQTKEPLTTHHSPLASP
jgi:hypothetical protein